MRRQTRKLFDSNLFLELDFILNFMPPAGLVFEDAPSGIRSGNAAGCKTVGLLTTHTREQIEAAQPDFIINNLSA